MIILPLRLCEVPSCLEGEYKSLEELLEVAASFYEIAPLESPMGPYLHHSCTCPIYRGHLYCKHAIAIAYLHKKFAWPIDQIVPVTTATPMAMTSI